MNYEKFLNIANALVNYTNYNKNIFLDFGYCTKYKLISDNDIDYFRELRDIYLRSRPVKKLNSKKYLEPQVLACAIIIIKYPNETFENSLGTKTKLEYLIPKTAVVCDRHCFLVRKSNATLLEKATALDKFMKEI